MPLIIILAAMAPYEDLQILLKVHPEEGELRIAAYLAIAEEMGMAHRVQSVTAPPAPLIEASDLVLACYSATLVEAALAGRPAFSVSNADTRYPMPNWTPDTGWRIDYHLASPALAARVTDYRVARAEAYALRWSDHAPVVADYAF